MVPGIVYLVALILGGGTVAVQLVMASQADGGDGGIDAAGDLEAPGADASAHEILHTAQFDMDAQGTAGDTGAAVHHGSVSEVGGLSPLVLSLRFWTFALLAFGLVGSVLHFFRLGTALVTPAVSLGTGVLAGLFASWSFRALAQGSVHSGAGARDTVGQLGRVLIPLARGSRGKVRITLRGQSIDYLATTDEAALAEGDRVFVEDIRDGVVHVSRAPAELLSSSDPNQVR